MSVALQGPVAKQMSGGRVTALVGLLLALSAGVALFIGRPVGSSQPDGGAVRLTPTFSLPDLRPGRPPVVLEARPGKATVVNFFAAWCEPCKKELPVLRDAAQRHAGEVVFLGVDHQDSRADAVELLDRFGITYPAGYDPKGEVAADFGLRGLPATVFIGADGQIVDVHHGELNARQLDERLRRLTLQRRAS